MTASSRLSETGESLAVFDALEELEALGMLERGMRNGEIVWRAVKPS